MQRLAELRKTPMRSRGKVKSLQVRLCFIGSGLLLLLVMQSLFNPAPALACMCGDYTEPPAAMFVGKVVRIEWDGDEMWSRRRVLFEVSNAWRGVDTSYVTVSTQGDCGAVFEQGEAYLVNASRGVGSEWVTSWCAGSRGISMTDEVVQSEESARTSHGALLEMYGKGTILKQISAEEALRPPDLGFSWEWVSIAIITTVVIVSGLWLLIKFS
jgi:hypothetical protein